MGLNLAGAITVAGAEAMEEDGATTEVADWVIQQNLSSAAFLLYLRMCYLAKDADPQGVQLQVRRADADKMSRSDGRAAMDELLEVGAVTKLPASKYGSSQYRIEIYSPEVRRQMSGHAHVGGLPVVSFG